MFAGKTEEIIRDLKKPGCKNKRILVLKPEDDNRQVREIFTMIESDKFLKTYKKIRRLAIKNSPEEFKKAVDIEHSENTPQILVVEEAQFMGLWLIDLVTDLLDIKDEDDDFTIIVSGLDKDYLKNAWGPIPVLMLHADEVLKLSAVCHKCEKRPATLTYKVGGNLNMQKEVGSDIYQARCRSCHKLPS